MPQYLLIQVLIIISIITSLFTDGQIRDLPEIFPVPKCMNLDRLMKDLKKKFLQAKN